MPRRPNVLARVLAAGLAVGFAAHPSDTLAEDGRRAPEFEGVRLDGTAFASSELAGSFVLLDFWGVWCPPCIGAFPKLSRLHESYAERAFQVVGLAVLSGTPEEVAEFLADYDVTYPIVVVERAVPDAFDVLAYPSYFLIGPDSTILRAYQGQPTDLYEIVSRDLEELLPPPASP